MRLPLGLALVWLLLALPLGRVEADPASRVVSLSLMTDELVTALLPPQRILALSRAVDDPVLSNAVEAARPVKARAWLNLELLVSLAPDLILAADWADTDALAFLRKKGYAVYVVKTPRTWTEVKTSVQELGGHLGVPQAARDLLAQLASQEAELERVRRKITRPVTVLEYNSFGSTMGGGTLWDDMTALAGVKNLAQGLNTDAYGYAPLSREMLVRLDPDWLILPSEEALEVYGQPGLVAQWKADPLFRGLGAVRTGRLLFLPESLKTSTSHAVLGAALALQRAAYPDLR